MIITKLILIFLLSFSNNSPLNEYKHFHYTIIGTTNILSELFEKFDHTVVFFHLPNCVHCQNFEKKFQKLAKEFRKIFPLVPFVDFNCNNFSFKCANILKINQFPTIRVYYDKNTHINFRQKRTYDNLKNWITERIDSIIYIINKDNKYLIENLLNDGDGIIILNGNKKSSKFNFYYKTSQKFDSIYFFISEDEEIIKEYNLGKENTILFIKKENYLIEEEYKGPDDSNKLINFIENNIIDSFKKYDNDLFELNKSFPKVYIILFCNSEEEDLIIDFHYTAREMKDKFYFIHIDLNKENNNEVEKLIYDLGIDKSNMPTIRAIKYKNLDNSVKWKLENKKLNIKNIKYFINEINFSIEPYIKNDLDIKNKKIDKLIEPLNSFEVLKKVYKNFDSDYILFIHDSFDVCKKSLKMNNILIHLLNDYKDKVIFYSLNMHYNEIKKIEITQNPSIIYFKKFDVNRKNYRIFKEFSFEKEDIKQFIETNIIEFNEL